MKPKINRYIVKEGIAKELLSKYNSINNLSKITNINYETLHNCLVEEWIMLENTALRISKALHLGIEDMFDQIDVLDIEKDVSYMQLAEQIIMGLKLNIENRLLISHSKSFVKEILDLVDQIAIESAYLGVQSQKDGVASFIVNAAQKRRK